MQSVRKASARSDRNANYYGMLERLLRKMNQQRLTNQN